VASNDATSTHPPARRYTLEIRGDKITVLDGNGSFVRCFDGPNAPAQARAILRAYGAK
jgi:hypothetical protein